ncbi:hypothetical protein HDU76_013909 [Blyttiomyces sp. JEL0837]|nr:hypothetical protein HDU76_013909 [Blyttiomyces sp. JEL0837]
MSAGEEDNKDYPTTGISLTHSQATTILKSYTTKTLSSLIPLSRGYNNKVYELIDTESNSYIIKIGGKYWTRKKTECEIASLVLVRKYCVGIPVPNIVAWSSKTSYDDNIDGFHHEFVLLEKMSGEPLDVVWTTLMNSDQKRNVLSQLARMVVEFKMKLSLLYLDGKIGNMAITRPDSRYYPMGQDSNDFQCWLNDQDLTFDEGISRSIHVGATLDGDGPFESYLEYMRSYFKAQLKILDSADPKSLFATYIRPLRSRIVALMEKLPYLTFMRSASASNSNHGQDNNNRDDNKDATSPIVFCHGDIAFRNILVVSEVVETRTPTATIGVITNSHGNDRTTKEDNNNNIRYRISALLDWEWAGMFPFTTDMTTMDFLDPDQSQHTALTPDEVEWFWDELEKESRRGSGAHGHVARIETPRSAPEKVKAMRMVGLAGENTAHWGFAGISVGSETQQNHDGMKGVQMELIEALDFFGV